MSKISKIVNAARIEVIHENSEGERSKGRATGLAVVMLAAVAVVLIVTQ